MEIAQTNDNGLVAVYGVSSGGYAVGQKIGDYAEFNSETLLEIIAVLSNQGMLDIIESIDMSQPLKIGMTTTYGYTVNIGQPENLTGKLENLPPVLSKVLSMGLEGGTIDLGVLGRSGIFSARGVPAGDRGTGGRETARAAKQSRIRPRKAGRSSPNPVLYP